MTHRESVESAAAEIANPFNWDDLQTIERVRKVERIILSHLPAPAPPTGQTVRDDKWRRRVTLECLYEKGTLGLGEFDELMKLRSELS